MDGQSTNFSRISAVEQAEDAKVKRLQELLQSKLQEAADVEVELSRAQGAVRGVVHYSVFENRAHEIGRKLSRLVQRQQMSELAAAAPRTVKCPTCGKTREVTIGSRELSTIDGKAVVQEVVATCCRKKFSPS